ncbi:uncharacterized protein LOC130201972 [Pseudoliparis swirei]|uniref:uncharacterized protein LOC130201972 n=1 Tax=Pseudoliparis swirei TaxID=2059687 RepID=UPI0024BEBDBA|nr:uncharacterized protein LOC130201972 [Pseudoliparis swirei]
MDNLSDFLRQRNVPEETIETLEHEKIDASTIQLMTDEELKTYLPSYGDRLAVSGFCQRKENSHSNTRKSKLFERLKQKLAKRKHFDEGGSSTSEGERSHPSQKRNALKTMRKIEIGWMHYDDEKEVFKQVRARRGGGTRKVDVSKDAQKRDLIQEAIGLFFPDNINSLGSLTDFELDLKDYQEVMVDNVITVGQLYIDTKLPLLRFYLTTQKKIMDSPHSHSAGLAPSLERQVSSQNPSSPSSLSVATAPPSATFETVNPEVIFLGSTPSDDNYDFALYSTQGGSEDAFESSNVVFVGDFSENEQQNLDDTLPVSPQTISSSERVKRILVVHRGQVLRELIAHFCDDGLQDVDIKIQLVLPDGTLEMGYDDGGVVRDCLSEFWSEFYDQCATGNALKVPFLRHDFGQQQWESVGRIIAFGWAREKYLPVKIAPVILEQAAFGYAKSDVVENFLKYMPESERTVFESWRSDFNSVDQEELIEILDNHSCRRLPTASNVNEILQELAHKRLVQEPAYVIEQWAKILSTAGHSLQDLTTVYETLQPTVRKVVKSLSFPETMNVHQKDIQKYLTTYLRNADMQHLCLFLRFCTGSDLFLGKDIIIDFTLIQGFQRRPVAHTCGCVLKLSVHYDSSPDFSSEMNKVLESNVWVMDII